MFLNPDNTSLLLSSNFLLDNCDELHKKKNWRRVCWQAFQALFVLIVLINVIALFCEPSPILRVFEFHDESDVKDDHKCNEFTLKHVERSIISLTLEISNLKEIIFKNAVNESCDVFCELEAREREINALKADFANLSLRSVYLNETLENLKRYINQLENARGDEEYRDFSKIQTIINKALMLYDADKLGIPDYALEFSGGSITSTPSTPHFHTTVSYKVLGILKWPLTSNPSLMIQPGILPGQCFAFAGQNGRIRIALSATIKVTSVTVDSAHPSLLSKSDSSPRDFSVYGLVEADSDDKELLGSFTYKLGAGTHQTFAVSTPGVFRHVELHILTNYGNPDYTCIYRFRVHGTPAD